MSCQWSLIARLTSPVLLAAFLVVGVAPPPAAQAQAKKAPANNAKAPTKKYSQYPPDPKVVGDARQVRALEAAAGRILRGTEPFDESGRKTLDTWYKDYFFRVFTMQKSWSRLPELRNRLLEEDLRRAKSADAYKFVIDLTYRQMRYFTQPRFKLHPAVRYNAMLLLGELDSVQRNTRNAQGRMIKYPVPYAPAFKAMITEFVNADQIDAVRVAALVGILRHAKLDRVAQPSGQRIPGDQRMAAVNAMLETIKSEPPAGRTLEGHTWMQRRAVDIVAALGAVGAHNETTSTLVGLVDDESAPVALRVTIAKALGRWTSGGNVKVDAVDLSKKLGKLAAEACKLEYLRVQELLERDLLRAQVRELIAAPPLSADAAAEARGSGRSSTNMMSSMMSMGAEGGAADAMAPGGMMMAPDVGLDEEGGEADGMGDMDYLMQSGMAGAMPGMTSPESGQQAVEAKGPADPRVNYFRRRLKYRLAAVKSGLGETTKLASGENAAELKRILDTVDVAYQITDPAPDDLFTLARGIRESMQQFAFLAPVELEEEVTDPAGGPRVDPLDPTAETPPLDPMEVNPLGPAAGEAPGPEAPAEPPAKEAPLPAEPGAEEPAPGGDDADAPELLPGV